MAFSSYGLSSMWCSSSSPRLPAAGRGPYNKISRLSLPTSAVFQHLKKRPDGPAIPVSFGSSPSSFNSLLRPQPGSGSGGGGGGGGGDNNGNDRNPFNSGEGWGGGSPYSSFVFLILPFFCRPFRFSLLDTGKGALLAFLSLLGCFCHSQSALARSASDGVWEVRGGKWTRVVSDHSNDAFLLADPLKAAATVSSFIFSPWRVFLGLMLPEGYPHSVSGDYLEYSLWRGVQGVASQISSVLATQALLYAVGLGRGAIPTAAAVNWVLKDGIGYLSKIFLSKFGRHFDVNPKGWRLFADLLENIAYGLELLTPAFPCHFVLIGAAAGAGRSAAALIQAATRSCFYAGFAAQRNFAEVIAKGEAQGMVSKSLGIVLGIVLANHIGSSTPLAISSFIIIASIHMFCNLKSYQSIQLRTLNPYRASLVFSEYLLSGQVPPVEEVNDAEPLFPKLALFSADHMQKRNCEALMLLQKNGLQKKNPSIAVVATLFGDEEDVIWLEQNHLAEWGEVELDGLLKDGPYDEFQLRAIALGLNRKRPFLVIQGPPGTGKTGLLKELIVLSVQRGERVLVTAPTNAAVDNMVERLSNVGLNIVRVGNPARISKAVASKSLSEIVNEKLATFRKEFERKKADLRKDLRHCLKDDSLAAGIRQLLKQLGKTLKKKEKDTVKEVLSGAQVVLATNTGAADPYIRRLDNFDLVVIDEAGQAIEPSCWIPILQGKRCILAGDHCQLAPVILSRKAMEGGLGVSLLERAFALHKGVLAMKLRIQYRMNDAIATWASKEMYDGLLKSSSTVSSHLLVDSPFVKATWITQCPLLLLDTRMPYGRLSVGCEEHLDPAGTGSFYNEGEADIVLQHVFSLIYSGVSPTAIAVQSPYVAQVQLLRDRLDELPMAVGVEVATIDSFQGREADAVIISMVRSNNLGAVGFLGDSRRMNVAITRARKHVAVVCDSSTICHNTFLARLLRHIRRFGRVKHAEPGTFGGSGLSMNPMLPSIS